MQAYVRHRQSVQFWYNKRVTKRRGLSLLLGTLLICGAYLAVAQDSEVYATAYQTVNVRSGPGTQYEIVGQLNAEDRVPVTGRDSEMTRWLQVSLPDSDVSGWVAYFTVTLEGQAESLPVVAETPVPGTPVPARIISYGRVNVRSGPGVSYDMRGQLEVGDEAQITARSNYNNDWLYIENDAISGWVAYFTVQVEGRLDEIPVRLPDASTGELVPPATLIHANFNARLHSAPNFRATVLVVIPYQTSLTPTGITPDGRWLYLNYEGHQGWAWARLFDLSDEQRAQIPTRRPPSNQ